MRPLTAVERFTLQILVFQMSWLVGIYFVLIQAKKPSDKSHDVSTSSVVGFVSKMNIVCSSLGEYVFLTFSL